MNTVMTMHLAIAVWTSVNSDDYASCYSSLDKCEQSDDYASCYSGLDKREYSDSYESCSIGLDKSEK